MNSSIHGVLKVALVGEAEVGKTQILQKYVHNTFAENYSPTIGVEFSSKELMTKGKNYSFQIWDTAGQQRFKAIPFVYYRGAAICIIVYDITNRLSFEKVSQYYKQIVQCCQNDVMIVVVGNKSDLQQQRKVEVEQGQALAIKMKAFFLQTSAKDAVNIQKAFTVMINRLG